MSLLSPRPRLMRAASRLARRDQAFCAVLGMVTVGNAAVARNRLRDAIEGLVNGIVRRIGKPKPVQTEGDPNQPLAVKVPADKVVTSVCGFFGGEFKCTPVTLWECPDDIYLVNDAGTGFVCDVTCEPDFPDVNGNCDCSIRYDTCRTN